VEGVKGEERKMKEVDRRELGGRHAPTHTPFSLPSHFTDLDGVRPVGLEHEVQDLVVVGLCERDEREEGVE
jgi:hypothetical protein